MKNKSLFIAASIALIFYVASFFLSGPPAYPTPSVDKDEVYDAVNEQLVSLGFSPLDHKATYSFQTVANQSIGRYVQKEKMNENQLDILSLEIPLYTIQIDQMDVSIEFDPINKQITQMDNIHMEMNDIDQFVADFFGHELTFVNEEDIKSFFSFAVGKRIYEANTTYSQITKRVEVEYDEDDVITSFHYFAESSSFPAVDHFSVLLIFGLYSLAFMGLLALAVTIHFIIKLVQRKIEAVLAPLFFALSIGVGWFFIGTTMTGGNVSFLSFIDAGMWTYIVFLILMIRWKKQPKMPFSNRIGQLRSSVWNGFLWTFISLTLTTLYFYIANEFFDTWVSPVDNFGLLFNINIWLLPLFTFFIGYTAAVTEETVFRHYMIPIFDKLTAPVSLVLTSFLWGILHIGYDMYPWYLYVLEFMLITGPLFYIVYKKHGFTSAIFLHYFYNAWVTTLFAFTIDTVVGVISLLVTLLPFVVFIFPKQKTTIETIE